jgi:hypothetical protein
MASNERLFPVAPYDRLSKAVTIVICALLAGIVLIPRMPWFIAVLDALLVLAVYALSPRAYVVAEGRITVKRLLKDCVLPLDGLREARAAASDDLAGAIKVWGNGGMFGYYGLFRTTKLGKCRWYLTDKSKAVVVATAAKTFLFSPADPAGFLAAVGAPPPVARYYPPEPAGITAGGVVAVAVLVTVFAVLAFAFLYAPGPPGYTLTPEALTIHDRFYPVTIKAAAVDDTGIRVVDLSDDPDWRAVAKTDGFANSHYQSGWFRLANGKTVEMYRAGGQRLVLLPGKNGAPTVLYQPETPDKFAEQIQLLWLP